MQVYNFVYPNVNYSYYQNKRNNNVSNINFTGATTISKTYGILSAGTQESLKNLHENMDYIHDLFLKFAHNPQKAIAIKNGYTDLIQKNRNSGISFALPDNQGILIIRRLLKNSNLLRFVVEKDGKLTHFLTDGYDKSVANVNQNNPQFLPRVFRYMMPDEIKESNIEKYIGYTDGKIQKYKTYLEQFNGPNKPETESVMTTLKERNAEKMRKYRASKKQKTKEPELNKTLTTPQKYQLEKSDLKDIMDLFQVDPEDFPPYIKPVISPANKVLGFNLQTSDGATLKVSKKLNAKYGGNMTYLSIEKLFPDGGRSYMSIDLQSYKFLKMKDLGKPLIRNNNVYEYDKDEIIKRNMVEKFQAYVKEIFREEKNTEIKPEKPEILSPEIKTVAETKPAPKVNEVTPVHLDNPVPAPEINIPEENFEKLKQITLNKATEDAKTLSDLYFKKFVEEFNKSITEKLTEFKTNIDKFFNK